MKKEHHFIEEALARNEVVVVPGFQGQTSDGQLTTLGRGGSDTTALALAASLHADRCEILKDVPAVFYELGTLQWFKRTYLWTSTLRGPFKS